MVIGTYILITTLNVNGLNAPTKRHRLVNGYKNKTHIYAVYKRSTSDLGTHTDFLYWTFHPRTKEYTVFSSAHGTFSRIDHILGHYSSLGKFKITEIVSSMFPDHNVMGLDINYRKKFVKNTSTWRLNNTLINNQEITEEIKEEIKKIPRKKMTMKTR